MIQSPTERHHNAMLPINKVVTTIETKEMADQAITSLIKSGIAENDIFLHHGAQGQQYIDPDGSQHGFLSKLRRTYQRLTGTEKRMLDDADNALKAGHYLIGVQTHGDEEKQVIARDALSPRTDNAIYFCGHFTILILEMAKGK